MIMAFWLMKTEPSKFSYGDLEREKRAVWDGVTNNTALIHIRAMRKGDRALIYHSGGEKSIVGIADIVSDSYSDPKWGIRGSPSLISPPRDGLPGLSVSTQ
jgi:predicted RNA-binding protein with PUA-like domain